MTTKKPSTRVEVLEFVTCNCKKKADARQINAHVFPSTWFSISEVLKVVPIKEDEEDDDYENVDDDDWDDMIDDEKDLLDNDDIWLWSEFLVKRNFLFILNSNFALLQRYSCFIW